MNFADKLVELRNTYDKHITQLELSKKNDIIEYLESQCPIIISEEEMDAIMKQLNCIRYDILEDIDNFSTEFFKPTKILKKYNLYSHFYIKKKGQYIPKQNSYLYCSSNRIMRVLDMNSTYDNIREPFLLYKNNHYPDEDILVSLLKDFGYLTLDELKLEVL